jgi:xanthine/CO dehydrogenase XdhC/CoxF family maturation factor
VVGALERDVLGKAWWRTQEGPLVVTYDSTSADDEETWTFGLGCNGRVDVLLERLAPSGEAHPLDFIARCLETRRPGVMATVFRGGPDAMGRRLVLDADGVRSDLPTGRLRDVVREAAEALTREGRTRSERIEDVAGPHEVLLEVVRPPRSLVIFGTGQDAVPLVRLAAGLGFHLTVVSNTSGGAPADLFQEANIRVTASPSAVREKLVLEDDAAVVIMTHNLSHDRGYLRFALESACTYVGGTRPPCSNGPTPERACRGWISAERVTPRGALQSRRSAHRGGAAGGDRALHPRGDRGQVQRRGRAESAGPTGPDSPATVLKGITQRAAETADEARRTGDTPPQGTSRSRRHASSGPRRVRNAATNAGTFPDTPEEAGKLV